MTRRPLPTVEEIFTFFSQDFFDKHSNWGRWGKDDQMGTLNYITPAKRLQAAKLIKDGETVSCARPVTWERGPDVIHQPMHFMHTSGERWVHAPKVEGQMQGAADWFGMAVHGLHITHLDSLGHHFRYGKAFNGFSADKVNTHEGATVMSVELARKAIVTRGVLLDMPLLFGVKYLERGEPLYMEDLLAAEKSQGIKVEPGDALLVRTGAVKRLQEEGPADEVKEGRAGLHGNTIPYLHERGVAVLCSDAANDVIVPGHPMPFRLPIHHVGIAGMGLWLIDNGNLEDVAEACAARKRWEFSLTVAPLRLHNATGSPVNPIAVF